MFCRQVMSLPSASRTGSQPSATSCAGSRRSKNPAVRIVAGLALEKVTGQGYREYVVEHVFGPATMRTAGFFDRRDPAHDVAEGWDPVRDADGRLITWRQNIFSYPPIGSPDGGAQVAAVRGADRRVAEDVLPPGD